ncbi:hypothetical protein CPB84DRAFT_1674454 [Gymnopilus junonius]|uniref:Uncharacterized protein n=1 Tax=Gymnopilus junonius TaxID=109634 RepID=A0A9P5NX34_GYMJU|nr:hypothetical protein CPB84DRAFT_1674454 [Gymnopilus junonius]
MSLPLELVNEIVHYILDSAPPRSGDSAEEGQNLKPDWNLIRSFTLTSHAFRHLGLASWFRQLYLPSASDLEAIDTYFPLIKSQWCRHLHCVQPSGKIIIWDLSGFQRLFSLRLDWLKKSRVDYDETGDVIPFIKADESPIRDLEIRGVRYLSPMMLNALTCPFAHVMTLKLHVEKIWCGLCHTVNSIRFPTPAPKSFEYKGGLGLPIHYARVLYSLGSLEKVYIRILDRKHGVQTPGLSADSNDNFWVGECDRCMLLMYDDEKFLKAWVARKRGSKIDGIDEKVIYKAPPRLQLVQWDFYHLDVLSDTEGEYDYLESAEEDLSDDPSDVEFPQLTDNHEDA